MEPYIVSPNGKFVGRAYQVIYQLTRKARSQRKYEAKKGSMKDHQKIRQSTLIIPGI